MNLEKIVLSRLRHQLAESSPLHQDAQKMLHYLRGDEHAFVRKPGVAELLDWLYELTRERKYLAVSLNEHPNAQIAAKTTLLKHAQDQQRATEENWKKWLDKAGLLDEQADK